MPKISFACIDCGKERIDYPKYFEHHGGKDGYRCADCNRKKILLDPENRKKIKNTMASEEYHKAASDRKRKWWADNPDQVELQSKRQTKLVNEMWADPSIRERLIASGFEKWNDPKIRDIYSKASQLRWENLEEREKFSVMQKEIQSDPIMRKKKSDAMKQRYIDDPEEHVRNRNRQILYFSNESARNKLSLTQIEKFKDPEYKRLHLEKSHSPEALLKLSESLKKAYVENPELGKAISKRQKEKMSIPENCPTWKGGVSFLPYCRKFSKEFKERVRSFFGRICFECGKTEKENGNRLIVHHVNYDKMVCCNDVKPLFVPLCKSCHSKTNYNREEWEIYFTDLINNEYNGKCYFDKEEMNEYLKIHTV